MMLPALPPDADTRSITERLNRLIREFNRGEQDLFAPISAPDTGTADAHAIAPVPGIGRYLVHQVFAFKAARANATPAPTLAVNGLAAGTIVLPSGDPLVAGDIAADGTTTVSVASVEDEAPTFHLMNPQASALAYADSVGTAARAYADTIGDAARAHAARLGVRAWANWTGGTTRIGGSFNVSSITRLGGGLYYVNFATAAPSVAYVALAAGDGGPGVFTSARPDTAARAFVYSANTLVQGYQDASPYSFAAFW